VGSFSETVRLPSARSGKTDRGTLRTPMVGLEDARSGETDRGTLNICPFGKPERISEERCATAGLARPCVSHYDTTMQEPHRKRRRVFNEPGHAHYLTYSCVHRWPLLANEGSQRWVVEAMERVRGRHHFDLYAYVIMPEHVHLLVRPQREAYDISRFLSDLKRPVSCKAKRHLQETHQHDWLKRLTVKRGSTTVFRFWQPGGGFDQNIWETKALQGVIEYIQANPVRRGLVEEPTEWPWSSAQFWAGMEGVPLTMDPLPM